MLHRIDCKLTSHHGGSQISSDVDGLLARKQQPRLSPTPTEADNISPKCGAPPSNRTRQPRTNTPKCGDQLEHQSSAHRRVDGPGEHDNADRVASMPLGRAGPVLQPTRAPIEHSVAVVGAPASAVGQSTTAQRLRISWTFDPATLAAARFNEPYRSGAARLSMFVLPDHSFGHPAQRRFVR